MAEIIRLEGLKAKYPYSDKIVLREISFTIFTGDFITLLGPNGAGKSTLFKVIYGTLPAMGGKIFFRGEEIKKANPVSWLKNMVRYLPQGGKIFPDLSIRDNFYMAGRFLPGGQVIKGIEDFFSLLEGIPDGERIINNFNKKAGGLSGGQRQVIALGMSLLGEPGLLFLDEPTAGLAVGLSEKLLSRLKEKNKENGLTVLVVEHNLKSVLKFSNRVFNMTYGKISEMGKEDFSDVEILREKILQSSESGVF
jgi:branched-chain amino acid transport system ATP-binding protein